MGTHIHILSLLYILLSFSSPCPLPRPLPRTHKSFSPRLPHNQDYSQPTQAEAFSKVLKASMRGSTPFSLSSPLRSCVPSDPATESQLLSMDLAKVEEERESSILEDAIPPYNYYHYNKMDHQRVVMALNRLSPENFRRAMHIIMTDEQHKVRAGPRSSCTWMSSGN